MPSVSNPSVIIITRNAERAVSVVWQLYDGCIYDVARQRGNGALDLQTIRAYNTRNLRVQTSGLTRTSSTGPI